MRVALLLTMCAGASALAAPAPESLVGAALTDGGAYATARSLVDGVGPRMTGSAGAARAVDWAVAAMKAAGLEDVHTEPVQVARWVRGDDSVAIVAPVERRLVVAALGPSVPTKGDGLRANILEVGSLDELRAAGARARGKVVFFDKQMPRTTDFSGYGSVVGLRAHGAAEAAKLGAVAALVRSAGTGDFRLPHAGNMKYEDGVPQIPALAVAAEDADLLHRLGEGGKPVEVVLRVASHPDGEVASANVVGELRGTGKPDEVVLLGAHLDSWDLGDGAIDDAAGIGIVLETARLVARFGRTRRTIRVVLYMNEESGLAGAKAYAALHKGELGRHAAALEADAGAGRATGFGAVGPDAAVQQIARLAAPLATLGAAHVESEKSAGADLIPLQQAGVPVVEMAQDVSRYFDWHHTAADTLDKIDPAELAQAAAAFAVVAVGLADDPARLPPSPPPPNR